MSLLDHISVNVRGVEFAAMFENQPVALLVTKTVVEYDAQDPLTKFQLRWALARSAVLRAGPPVFNAEEYVFCQYCPEFFDKDDLEDHETACKAKHVRIRKRAQLSVSN